MKNKQTSQEIDYYRTPGQNLSSTPAGVMIKGDGFRVSCHKFPQRHLNREAALRAVEVINK